MKDDKSYIHNVGNINVYVCVCVCPCLYFLTRWIRWHQMNFEFYLDFPPWIISSLQFASVFLLLLFSISKRHIKLRDVVAALIFCVAMKPSSPSQHPLLLHSPVCIQWISSLLGFEKPLSDRLQMPLISHCQRSIGWWRLLTDTPWKWVVTQRLEEASSCCWHINMQIHWQIHWTDHSDNTLSPSLHSAFDPQAEAPVTPLKSEFTLLTFSNGDTRDERENCLFCASS